MYVCECVSGCMGVRVYGCGCDCVLLCGGVLLIVVVMDGGYCSLEFLELHYIIYVYVVHLFHIVIDFSVVASCFE